MKGSQFTAQDSAASTKEIETSRPVQYLFLHEGKFKLVLGNYGAAHTGITAWTMTVIREQGRPSRDVINHLFLWKFLRELNGTMYNTSRKERSKGKRKKRKEDVKFIITEKDCGLWGVRGVSDHREKSRFYIVLSLFYLRFKFWYLEVETTVLDGKTIKFAVGFG